MVQALFPDDDGIFQDVKAPMNTAHVVKNWYEKHESELEAQNTCCRHNNLQIVSKSARTGFNRRMYEVNKRRIEVVQKAGKGPTLY